MAPRRWYRRQQCLIRWLPGDCPGPGKVWHRCLGASCYEASEGCCEVSSPTLTAVRFTRGCFSLRLPHTLKPGKYHPSRSDTSGSL